MNPKNQKLIDSDLLNVNFDVHFDDIDENQGNIIEQENPEEE